MATKLQNCTRCGGSMLGNGDGTFTCMLCGQVRENGQQHELGPLTKKLAPAWDELALERLKDLIAKYEESRAVIDEARRLRRVLVLWGTKNLPTIPSHVK